MSEIPAIAQHALNLARAGDLAGAIEAARAAVASHPDDYGLRLFIATLHSRRFELQDALPHLRAAIALAPGDPLPRVELVRLLIGLGRTDEAERELSGRPISQLEDLRLRAMISSRREEHGKAAQFFGQVVAADPNDYESWGNLGGCLLANGQPRRAIAAFGHAVKLRPDIQKFREKLMQAQVEAGEGEQALASAREFARTSGGDSSALVAVARLEDLLERPETAVHVLRECLAKHENDRPALIALAGLLERQNRVEEFAGIVARLEALDPDAAELPLLRAQLAFRTGDLKGALALAESAPEMFNRAARAQLIGTIQDRLGNSNAAFAAFRQMNQETDLSTQTIASRAQALRNLLDRRAEVVTPGWVSRWSRPETQLSRSEPVFLIGFPRSGTTLLDTFLMGHPAVCVAEEKPMLQAVARQLGDLERLASLSDTELDALRECYFAVAASNVPDLSDRLLVDKSPLGVLELPLFHRLFPTAKILFTLRHPCDVVLSCFTTAFQPTPTLISFYRLEDSARLYDKVMAFWMQCRAAMRLKVYEIKYENLVANPEGQLRQLIGFLGIDWDDRVLHHQKAAEGRSFIGTASYAQVVEPLYERSIGRWQRYREQLEPVLPLLEPWAVKFGYEI